MTHRITRIIPPVLFFLLLFFGYAFAGEGSLITGQEGVGVQMQVKAGLDGFYRANIPFPVQVEIFNGGERIIRGQLVIRSTKWVPRSSYIRNVLLHPGERKKYDMLVYEGEVNELKVMLVNRRNDIVIESSAPLSECPYKNDVLIMSLSKNPGDFKFIDGKNLRELKQFKFARRSQYENNYPITQFSFSQIHIIKKIPDAIYRDLRVWEPISAVYVDLDSYVNLTPELKNRLVAWVKIGGEVLVYFPGNVLTQELKDKLVDDPLLSFMDWQIVAEYKFAKLPENHLLVNNEEKSFLSVGNLNNFTLAYTMPSLEKPLICKSVVGTGGVTFFCFDPACLNPARIKDWVEIMFQLGLLIPTPHDFIFRRMFDESYFNRSSKGSHLRTREERNVSGIMGILSGIFISYLAPVTLIGFIAFLFFRMKRRRIFLMFVLPILVLLALLWPGLMSGIKLGSRRFEAVHYLNLTDMNLPFRSGNAYIIQKHYPERGIFKIDTRNTPMFYDEYVSAPARMLPQITIFEDSPEFLISNEETVQPFRIIVSQSEGSGEWVEGVLEELPEGAWNFSIRNGTPYRLTNCAFFKFDETQQIPLMLPDISAESIVNGRIPKPDVNDNRRRNMALDAFIIRLQGGIFSFSERQELMYSLESMVTGLAYKSYIDPFLQNGSALFFAWTDELKSELEVDEAPATGPEITLVISRVKIKPYDNPALCKVLELETLLADKDETSGDVTIPRQQ